MREIMLYFVLCLGLIASEIHKLGKSLGSKCNSKLGHLFFFIDYICNIPIFITHEPMSFGVFVSFVNMDVMKPHCWFLFRKWNYYNNFSQIQLGSWCIIIFWSQGRLVFLCQCNLQMSFSQDIFNSSLAWDWIIHLETFIYKLNNSSSTWSHQFTFTACWVWIF